MTTLTYNGDKPLPVPPPFRQIIGTPILVPGQTYDVPADLANELVARFPALTT